MTGRSPKSLLAALASLMACTTGPAAGDADLQGSDAEVDAEVDVEADGALPLECGYPDGGYGFTPGTSLAPAELWSCDREGASLPGLWCDQRVTVVHLSNAWCFLCVDATALLLRDVLPELEGEPVTLIELLLEGEVHGQAATVEDCRLWTARFDPTFPVYVPPEGQLQGALDELAHQMITPTTLLVDAAGIIRFRTTIALPEHAEEQTQQLLTEIRALLVEPPL